MAVKVGRVPKESPVVLPPEESFNLQTPEDIAGAKQQQALDVAMSKVSFLYFLQKHAKIVETPTLTKPGGVIPFQLWEHLKQLIAALLTHRLIVVMKSRQIGVSWTIAAYSLWLALGKEGANIFLFSKGETEAAELLDKSRRIHSQLPEYMKLKMTPDSGTDIGFPTKMSSMRAFAATESAGASFTGTLVVCDEWDLHPFAAKNFNMAKPTIDAGGQFVGVFTVDKTKPDSLPKEVFRDAQEGKNGFFPLFFPWDVRPGRDENWYQETMRSTPTVEMGNLTPELYMEGNYPRSIDEALRTTQSLTAFEHRVIDEMMGETRNPLRAPSRGGGDHYNIDPLMCHIYQDYRPGEFYVAGSDTSHGVGKDMSVTVVINVRTGAVVADIMSSRLSPEELAQHSVRLLDIYHNPLWFIEDNDWGRLTITTAEGIGYRHLGYHDEKRNRVGVHTDERTRMEIWGNLIPAINNHQITIYNAEGLKQFYDVIRNAAKQGRIEASAGRKDDYPLAVGIAWLKRKEVKTEAFISKPIETLQFRRRR